MSIFQRSGTGCSVSIGIETIGIASVPFPIPVGVPVMGNRTSRPHFLAPRDVPLHSDLSEDPDATHPRLSAPWVSGCSALEPGNRPEFRRRYMGSGLRAESNVLSSGSEKLRGISAGIGSTIHGRARCRGRPTKPRDTVFFRSSSLLQHATPVPAECDSSKG